MDGWMDGNVNKPPRTNPADVVENDKERIGCLGTMGTGRCPPPFLDPM
jgi:hypothetical protein